MITHKRVYNSSRSRHSHLLLSGRCQFGYVGAYEQMRSPRRAYLYIGGGAKTAIREAARRGYWFIATRTGRF